MKNPIKKSINFASLILLAFCVGIFSCGMGVVEVHAQSHGDHEIKCSACNGSGKCKSCLGTGKKSCISCFGTRHVKCYACTGLGFTLVTQTDENGHSKLVKQNCENAKGMANWNVLLAMVPERLTVCSATEAVFVLHVKAQE